MIRVYRLEEDRSVLASTLRWTHDLKKGISMFMEIKQIDFIGFNPPLESWTADQVSFIDTRSNIRYMAVKMMVSKPKGEEVID